MATNKSNQETPETDTEQATDNVPATTEQDAATDTESVPELNTLEEKVDAYFKYTGLKLDYNCHMDMEFVELWYQTKYLTGKVYKWAMKPGARIVHYVDGVIYKAANMTDEIAERLMKENPAYAEQFINLMEK
jgi:hypothetical protein